MKADDRVSGAFLVVVAVAVCLQAIHYKIGSFQAPAGGFFPLLLGLLVGTLSIALFFQGVLSRHEVQAPSETLWVVLSRKRVWYIVLALVAYGLLLETLGFLLATFAVFTFILRAVEPQKWWVCTVGGLAASVGCYALFYLALGVPLPRGILGL